MSGSLNSKLVPVTLDWMFELSDKVFVLFALDTHGSSLSPMPPNLSPIIPAQIWVDGKQVQLNLLKINISSQATSSFLMSDEGLSFKCRFSGTMVDLFISYDSIVRLECPENDSYQEFSFIPVRRTQAEPESKTPETVAPARKPSHLTVVK